ncbi:hypothetical protein EK21DRAFT_101167 [Setomelanomma holmii]|uniref:Uncharacterized protein n=1 Tax=Setomelanomma holmii TaxID=210430 RepID=A0A9P4LM75_9PLEO|nr:hypothetical protein EK21DRAFT_101167 [Setomelanomma holmii]
MAFAGVISDLFGCARARRTREISNDAFGADDTAGGAVPLEDAQTSNTSPIDAQGGAHVTGGGGHEVSVGSVLGGASQISVPKERNDGSNKRNDVEVSLDQEKTKSKEGWTLERRLLVTTKKEVTEKAAKQPARAVEEEAERSVDAPSEVASTVHLSAAKAEEVPAALLSSEPFSTPEAHATTENEPILVPIIDATHAPAASESSEASQSSSSITAQHESEQAETHVSTATAALATCEATPPSVSDTLRGPQEVEPPISTTISDPKYHQFPTPVLDSTSREDAEQRSHKGAPVRLLDLAPEIRNLIYEHMIEETPLRMCRHDDATLPLRDGETVPVQRRQYYNLSQVCRTIRQEYLPTYRKNTEYIIDLWTQRENLTKLDALNGHVSIDIDAACFDMEPIDLLPMLRYLARTRRTDCRFVSVEGVIFKSISSIVGELNKLLPGTEGCSLSWLETVDGPIKRIDLHLFPHEDIQQYYRFHGGEPLLRIVYPSFMAEDWMKKSFKSSEYEAYLNQIGLDAFEMHVVVGHASRRTTHADRLPLNWRLSYAEPRASLDRAHRRSQIMVE